MPSLRAESLGHAFRDHLPLFRGARFHLGPGWTGLVGPNGAGKSTLLALLAGAPPAEGRVLREPRDGLVRLVPQAVDTPPADWPIDAAARRLYGRLGVPADAPARWANASPGERRRAQVAAALAAGPALLLLDEPSNHLDAEARAWLVEALAGFRGVGVLVAHDRALLDALCEATLWLEEGRLRLYPGGWSAARAHAAAEREAGNAAHLAGQEAMRAGRAALADARRDAVGAERQRSAGARMKDRHDSDARGISAQYRADRAAGRAGRKVEKARAALERVEAGSADTRFEAPLGRDLRFGWSPPRRPRLLDVTLPGLWVGDAAQAGGGEAGALDGPNAARVGGEGAGGEGAGGEGAGARAARRVGEARRLCGPLRVELGRQERLRVAGPNGAGKTTLLRRLLPEVHLDPGELLHLPQELPEGQAEAWLAALRALPGPDRGRVLQLVAALGVAPERVLASRALSFGEARKLGLALALGGEVKLAVLDEPTNHLDLPSVERLQAALSAWPGALLLVSHDEAFAAALCTRTLRLGGDGT